MPRNRFETILRVLRFHDPNNTNASSKEKTKYMITHCVKNFKKAYLPEKRLSLDEALLGYRRRLSFKQYIPLKRARFGITLHELSTSHGYILDVFLYSGAGTVKADKEYGHAYKIVMKILKPYKKGRPRCISG